MEMLRGKTAVVTGGSSGIGRAIAQRFAHEGARVLIVGRNEAALQETAAADEKIFCVAGDMTQDATIEKIMEAVRDLFGGQLDILVNNAGWCPVQPITEITIADYDRAFSLDVRALVNMTIHALPAIRKAKGSIINLSSVGSTHRAANLSMYQGAKAAVDNFTRVWALELAARRRPRERHCTGRGGHQHLECHRPVPGGRPGAPRQPGRRHPLRAVCPAGGNCQCGGLSGV